MDSKILLIPTAIIILCLYFLSSSHMQRDKRPLPFQRTQSRDNQESYQRPVFKGTTIGESAFVISDDFAFPDRRNTLKNLKKIVTTKWVLDLASIMTKWPMNRTVILMSGNSEFQKPLLNWMISAVLKANVSLKRIIIIAADKKLYRFLQERNIGSIFVPPTSIYDSRKIKLSTHLLICYSRFAVVRLLNHWGFTVANFDSDALILRDMQEIFDEHPASTIVASRGAKSTLLCAGGILFRSTRQMGK